jgi:hypothetical protein
MQRFKTLLLREWMQHQRGWLIMVGLPIVLMLAGAVFGEVQLGPGDEELPAAAGPLVSALGMLVVTAGITLALAWLVTMLQSPGLARRDVQDRSIEFWLSLPASHTQSLGATLLAHLLLWPWAALLAGLGGGLLGGLLLTVKLYGAGAWLGLPWGGIVLAVLSLALRLMLGLLLATLWLAPLTLGTMVASAWLKRWGVPAVVAATLAGGLVLDKVYGNPVVWRTLQFLGERASQALIATDRSGDGPPGLAFHSAQDVDGLLGGAPGWLLHDAGVALLQLASPAFLAVLMASSLAFGALVLRRQRGA